MPYIPDRMNPVDVAIINSVFETSHKLWDVIKQLAAVAAKAPCECFEIGGDGIEVTTLTCTRCAALDAYDKVL